MWGGESRPFRRKNHDQRRFESTAARKTQRLRWSERHTIFPKLRTNRFFGCVTVITWLFLVALAYSAPDQSKNLATLEQKIEELDHAGKYGEAIPLAQNALKLVESAVGFDRPDTAASCNTLGELYRKNGDYAKAEPLLQRGFNIREKALGPDHPDTATSLNNLADLYFRMGDYAKAEPLNQRALNIREKALGPDHPDTATTLNNLALLYWQTGNYAKAEPLYQRALKIREKALGPEHPDTATSLNNLAKLYR